MGLMSAMVSLRPSLRNHSHDLFWISMRLGTGQWLVELGERRTHAWRLGLVQASLLFLSVDQEKKSTPYRRDRGIAAGNARPKSDTHNTQGTSALEDGTSAISAASSAATTGTVGADGRRGLRRTDAKGRGAVRRPGPSRSRERARRSAST